jgi:hypothetical protein
MTAASNKENWEENEDDHADDNNLRKYMEARNAAAEWNKNEEEELAMMGAYIYYEHLRTPMPSVKRARPRLRPEPWLPRARRGGLLVRVGLLQLRKDSGKLGQGSGIQNGGNIMNNTNNSFVANVANGDQEEDLAKMGAASSSSYNEHGDDDQGGLLTAIRSLLVAAGVEGDRISACLCWPAELAKMGPTPKACCCWGELAKMGTTPNVGFYAKPRLGNK